MKRTLLILSAFVGTGSVADACPVAAYGYCAPAVVYAQPVQYATVRFQPVVVEHYVAPADYCPQPVRAFRAPAVKYYPPAQIQLQQARVNYYAPPAEVVRIQKSQAPRLRVQQSTTLAVAAPPPSVVVNNVETRRGLFGRVRTSSSTTIVR